MAGIAIVLDLLKKSHYNNHRIHSSSLSPASVVASAAAVGAPFASRFLFGSFEPRVAYCDAAAAAAGIDDDYITALRKVSVDALQLQPPTYIPSSKVYSIQPKPLFSAFEFRALAMTTVRSLLMFYLPLLEPKPASEEDDDDDFLNNAPEVERRRVDLIVPLKKSAKLIARETTVVTTRRVLERLAISFVSQRMAWKFLKDVPQSTLRKAGRRWPTHIYIYKVSLTTLRGHFLGVAASWTVQVGIEIYRCVFRYAKPEEEEEEGGEQVVVTEQAKDLGNKVVGITVRCGASLVFAAIGAGICSCLIRPSMGQWIGCALGDLAGPMVVSICLQKTLQADG